MRLAIFDLDGTVLRGNSWRRFFWWTLWHRAGSAPGLAGRLALRRGRLISARTLKEATLRPLRGLDQAAIRALGERIFLQELRAIIRPAARREVARAVAEGFEPMLATAAFEFLAAPVAEELGIREMIATQLEFSGGNFVGRIAQPEPRGPQKAAAVQAHFSGRQVDWKASRAFSDEVLDLPLLRLVGNPALVARRRPAKLPPDVPVVDWHDS
jgi:HAD superfamily hydrolase (TIGR01490 family)